MNKQRGWTLVEALTVILILGGIWGWIWNIVKLIAMSFDPLTGLLAVRIIGIFIPPLGSIVGYIPN